MGIKTGIAPPSVRTLILRHSKARVVTPSRKMFITGYDDPNPDGTPNPQFSRELMGQDVVRGMLRKYS